jgi:ribosome-binding factor A
MSKRRYARTDRVNELLREILAERLGRFDDERLELVTITGVEVDAGLEHAVVYYSSLADEEADASILEAFEDARRELQAAVASEARIRNTPRLAFRADHGIRQGQRVEAILRDLATSGGLPDDEVESAADTVGDDVGQGDDVIDEEGEGATGGDPEPR